MFDVDKIYMMRKSIGIKPKSRKEIKALLIEKLGNIREIEIDMFLDQVVDKATRQAAYQTYPDIAKVYRTVGFESTVHTEGKEGRDNEIVDMTYSVLTHESQTHRLLKPGGFEEQKRMGYYITALKLGYSKDELDKLSTNNLKKLCFKGSNLMYFSDQSKFYRQNSTAGTILGIFASERSNHAILEGDRLQIDKSELGISFSLGNTKYSGIIDLDVTFDSEGNFVGDTLGNLVAAAADAVKDPVLQLMNINSYTAGILTTMLRIGIPFKTAALFLSTSTISEVLETLNNASLGSYTSITEVLVERLNTLTESNNIDRGSVIANQDISEKQLIEDIRGNVDPSTSITILNTCLNLLNISKDISKVSKVTRLNSITSAVGPLMSDNLIYKEHFRTFPETITKEGKKVDLGDVLEAHPILKGFYDAYGIPKLMIPNAVAFSNTVDRILKDLSVFHPKIHEKLTTNRQELNSFLEFLMNYNMVMGENPAINSKELKYFIQDFPKEFVMKGIKGKYKDNKFIQAIQIESKKGSIILKINTTGMDETSKGELRDAWADLYKENPTLAAHLYKYAFFRGGTGFSPKTFMSLLPNVMRKNDVRRNKALTSFYDVDLKVLMDQYIGNNSDNYKIIKYINPKKSDIKFTEGKEGSELTTTLSALNGYTYFSINNKLYALDNYTIDDKSAEQTIKLREIPVLGREGIYLEISPTEISNPANLIETEDSNGLNQTQYLSELYEAEDGDVPTLFEDKEVIAGHIANIVTKGTKMSASSAYERLMSEDVELAKVIATLSESYNRLGIEDKSNEVMEEFKKRC